MIILLTDFGPSEYVGVMKGVIYSIDRRAQIVDLCHSVSSQNIIEASWILRNNYKYFPEGSVFCCVVDPGVGSERKALAVKTERYYFVAPDNGLLWEALKEQEVIDIREIPVPRDASHTFHGRDVFAPAAAKIGLGKFDQVGEKVGQIERLELYQDSGRGLVVRIDSFGNIITNIPKQGNGPYSVKIGEKIYQMNYRENYSAAKQGELFLIEGSNRTLEISLRNGSAHDILHLKTGTPIEMLCQG
jgi:S-adenosylmethionine hydrolase